MVADPQIACIDGRFPGEAIRIGDLQLASAGYVVRSCAEDDATRCKGVIPSRGTEQGAGR